MHAAHIVGSQPVATRHVRMCCSALDRLILDCVWPVLSPARDLLYRGCWERHYAGGPHLRVTLSGEETASMARRFG